MKLIFMGTPGFALPTLRALHEAGHEIVAVYTQPPRPAGRGMKLTPSPVHQYAVVHNLPVFTPASLKTSEAQAEFMAHGAEMAVVAAYGLLLPKAILEAPPRGCINVHPSLLPRWRGAAPIQRTLMAGDEETGVCIMQMDEGLDTGDVLLREEFTIPPEFDAGKLHDALAEAGAKLALRVVNGESKRTPQAAEGVTYAKKITKEDCRIDLKKSAREILNQIRALSPSPGAYVMVNGEPLKVFRASATGSGFTIECRDGPIYPLGVQQPGKKRMSAEEWQRGMEGKPCVIN